MSPQQQEDQHLRQEKDNGNNNDTMEESTDNSIEILLFDLDGTLYDHNCGYEQEIHSNIFQFMVDMKGDKFDDIKTIEEAQIAWQPIFDRYNLTKRGLIGEGYVFDSQYYDTYIRQGAEKYFTKDNELRSLLESFPSRIKKVVFTSAPESSANQILNLLGVNDLFDHVLGTDFLQSKICKPELEAFTKVMSYLNVSPSNYHRVCYFEDSFKNLKVGKELGFKTVFIVANTLTNEGMSQKELEEQQFDAILHGGKVDMTLKSLLPQLWSY
jgi:pyrimidine 5'-nucleotidase